MILRRQLCYPCRTLVQPQSILVQILIFFLFMNLITVVVERRDGRWRGRGESRGKRIVCHGEWRVSLIGYVRLT